MIEYFERGAAPINNSYAAGGVAPHVSTLRFTYTVPTGKYALLHTLTAFLIRDGAPGAAGVARGFYLVLRGGVTAYLTYATFLNAAVGTDILRETAHQSMLFAGDQVLAYTSDASTTGTVEYRLSAALTEFS